MALWNGKDAILKERLFGLGGGEGNHGEDVKEVYHFVDATPTHSYQKMVYRYPQDPFPYAELVSVNKLRSHRESEFELVDTGVFSGARFFDVTIEFAKADPDDILMLISIENAAQEICCAPCSAPALGAQHVVLERRRGSSAAAQGWHGRCARIPARQKNQALEHRLLC